MQVELLNRRKGNRATVTKWPQSRSWVPFTWIFNSAWAAPSALDSSELGEAWAVLSNVRSEGIWAARGGQAGGRHLEVVAWGMNLGQSHSAAMNTTHKPSHNHVTQTRVRDLLISQTGILLQQRWELPTGAFSKLVLFKTKPLNSKIIFYIWKPFGIWKSWK